MFAPVGTPPEIIGLFNSSIHEIVAIPEVKQRYAELGIEAKASTPEDVKARLEADIKKWAALIERARHPETVTQGSSRAAPGRIVAGPTPGPNASNRLPDPRQQHLCGRQSIAIKTSLRRRIARREYNSDRHEYDRERISTISTTPLDSGYVTTTGLC